jgi:hypothetical protein
MLNTYAYIILVGNCKVKSPIETSKRYKDKTRTDLNFLASKDSLFRFVYESL